MAKTVNVSIEQDPETSGFTVFVQQDNGWVAKLVSGVDLEAALVVVEAELKKLQTSDVQFRVGSLHCAQVSGVVEALRTEGTLQKRSESRLRADANKLWSEEEAETLPAKRGAS
jgi:hypothetical protein